MWVNINKKQFPNFKKKNNMTHTTKNIFTVVTLTGLLSLSLFQTSCKKKTTTPPNPNEEELITTFKITFTDSAGVQPSTSAMYRDLDGDGGVGPSIFDSIKLKPNTTYNASILLLDETKTPADTISNEVLEEGAEHLFCFSSPASYLTIQRTDKDVNNLEIGLQSKWKTMGSGNTSVQIVLRHQPDVKTGACEPGASDLDLTFQTLIQ
jgi:hypothetical protein